MVARLMLILGVLITIVSGQSHAAKFSFSKELDEFLTLKPIPDEFFENNLYVGWMGFGYPEDNWQIIYRDFFKIHYDEPIIDEFMEIFLKKMMPFLIY